MSFIPRSLYHAYLIRFWQAEENGRPIWRASLQIPGKHEQAYFASHDELFSFLIAQLSPDTHDSKKDSSR